MSLSVATFYALMLTIPSGYSYGAAVLFIGSLFTLSRGASVGYQLSVQDKTLCALLLFFFSTALAAVIWHQDSPKYFDQASRYLLAIPVLMALRRLRIRPEWLWLGLTLGLLGAAGIAWWQVHQLEFTRASGFLTSAIPFANISLTMAVWCLLGAWWAGAQHRWTWMAVLLLAALCGAYAFIAAATRGGLVALPVLAILMVFALLRRETLRAFMVACTGLAVVTVLLFTLLPATSQIVESRYVGALSEWTDYMHKGDASNNVGSRLEAWKSALISIPEKPLLGWGHKAYQERVNQLVDDGQIAPIVATLSNTHNNFLEILLHQGSLGLIAFLALLITSLWYFCQRLRAPDLAVRILACCGAGLIAAFSMYGLTQVILGRNNGVMFFTVSLVVLWAAMRQAEESGTINILQKNTGMS